MNKTKEDFRTHAVICLYRDYEERIKTMFKQQQKDANNGVQPGTLLICPPMEVAIQETMEMFYQAYLCGQENPSNRKKNK